MEIGFQPIQLVQIDATIIAGVLILLTITKFARSVGEDMPRAVSWVVVPFGASAVITLLEILLNGPVIMRAMSIMGMVLGFVYLVIVILDLVKSTKAKNS